MTFLLKIFKTDKRCKNGLRLLGVYEYDRKDRSSMDREIKELNSLYRNCIFEIETK